MARILGFIVLTSMLSAGCSQGSDTLLDDELLLISHALDARQPPAGPEDDSVAPVSAMIAGLKDRLAKNPDDIGGWTLLAQSYAFTGQMQDAHWAGDRAIELGADADDIHRKILGAHTGAIR